jgi:hypothetical protein
MIRDGTVRINDLTFRPTNRWLEYDGRLDGMRYTFGLYWTGDEMEPFVYLWGTEEDFGSSEARTPPGLGTAT